MMWLVELPDQDSIGGGEIVIDGNGQVRFHQKVLQVLGDLPEQPRILVASPDDKTVIFQFISTEYVESQEFRTIKEGKDLSLIHI